MDTLEWIRSAYRHTARRFGFEASDELLNRLYGRSLRACYQELFPQGDPDLLIACHRAYQESRWNLVRAMPGMREVLAAVREAGMRTALVTSRTARSTRATLARLGLAGLFDEVLTPEDTERHKPDPQPLLEAARRLGVPPARCVMVGDTHNDVQAGRDAGMATVGVTFGFIGDEVLEARPDHAASSPGELLQVLLGPEGTA